MQKLTSAYSLTDEKVSFEDYLNKSDVLYVSENKKIATKLVGQISFHQNGVPIELQQSGYIGNISYSNQGVNIQGVPFSKKEECMLQSAVMIYYKLHIMIRIIKGTKRLI